jgi:hypothetical protein
MTLYGKGEAADLTSREKQALRRAVEMESLQRAEKRRKRGSKVSRKK